MKVCIKISFLGNTVARYSFNKGDKYTLFNLFDSNIDKIINELIHNQNDIKFFDYWFTQNRRYIYDKMELTAKDDCIYSLFIEILDKNNTATIHGVEMTKESQNK